MKKLISVLIISAAFSGAVYAGFSIGMTDAGAAYLSFKDADSALTQGGMGFVLNFGINIYF